MVSLRKEELCAMNKRCAATLDFYTNDAVTCSNQSSDVKLRGSSRLQVKISKAMASAHTDTIQEWMFDSTLC